MRGYAPGPLFVDVLAEQATVCPDTACGWVIARAGPEVGCQSPVSCDDIAQAVDSVTLARLVEQGRDPQGTSFKKMKDAVAVR